MKTVPRYSVILLLLLWPGAASADDILLKDGREFSGKLVRADEKVVEFRTQGRIATFNVSEVSRIVFKEPELANSGRSRPEPAPTPREEPVRREIAVSPVEEKPVATDRSSPATPEDSVTLPEGTAIVVRTVQQIDTDQHKVGDTFEATIEEPLTQDGKVLAPRGSKVTGRIAWSEESGRVRGQSQLILELTELEVDSKSYALRTSDYVEVGASQGKRTATAATGGAVVGAIIGAIAGGGKGAAIGAAAGAGAGTGIQVLTKGQTLKVPAETILRFQLRKPLTLDVP